MDTFTIITGLASLFGFVIQAFDLFPKFGRARQVVFLLLVGVFIGSLLRAIDPSSVKLNLQFTGFNILIVFFVIAVIGFLIVAASSSDINKRNEFYTVAGIGFGAFIVVLLFGSLFTGMISSTEMEKQKVTISELNTLAERALQNRDFERAIMHLRTIESRVSRDDSRLKLVKEKIRQIELQELK
jgi:hypothetical protein